MIGYTLMHEHTTIDLSGVKGDTDCCLDCYEETAEEYRWLYEIGVRRIVDVTNDGMGRNPGYVSRIEKETGLQIVQSTGFYKEPFLPSWIEGKSVEELADFMIKEIEEGLENGTKAGMIGEIGTSKNEMKASEKIVFDAAAIAAKRTGKPIYTHTTLGTWALEQAEYLKQAGLDASRVVIGHIDLSGDLGYIRKVLATGVNVGFDTVGKNAYFPDEMRVEFLKELEKDGLLGQVVLSLDLTRKSHLAYKGGIGYTYLFEVFLPMLRQAGIKEESIEKMLIKNPEKILTGS